MSPYGATDPAKRHSAALTDGVDRAAARAMLKGVGFTDDDLARPLVGVATTWIETMPCNLNQRVLARHVKHGIRRAGGMPIEFNTISISDGVSMGTEGMRASLVSREVIADSIELTARGHLFDGLVCIVGCDKTIPAAVMALVRLDLPGLVLYGGSIAPGRYRGKDVTIQDVFEAVGAHAAGTMSESEVHALESVACPGAGACGGQFTANTMATVLDFLGVSSPGLNEIPANHPGKGAAAVRAGAARDGARAQRHAAVAARSPASRSRTRSPPSPAPAAPRTAFSICWRSRARRGSSSTSTTSTRSRAGRRSSWTSSPAGASSPPTCTARAASRSSRGSSSARASCTRRPGRSTAARSARSRRARRSGPARRSCCAGTSR